MEDRAVYDQLIRQRREQVKNATTETQARIDEVTGEVARLGRQRIKDHDAATVCRRQHSMQEKLNGDYKNQKSKAELENTRLKKKIANQQSCYDGLALAI